MLEKTLAILAVRIAGIFIGISILENGKIMVFSVLKSTVDPLLLLIVFIPTFLVLTLSIFMIFRPGMIVGKIISNESASAEQPTQSTLEFQTLAISILGLYFLVLAVIDVVSFANALISINLTAWQSGWDWAQHNFIGFVAMLIKLGAALLFIFGVKSIARFLKWARTSGA